MQLTRYGASCVVLPGTGPIPGYGLYAMRWSNVTLSAILSKVESKLFVTLQYDIFLGVSVITVQYYELYLVIMSCILLQYKLFLGALQCKS